MPGNNSWYMYVLHCHDKSYYCGITTNIKRRVEEHNWDKKRASKYAWSRRPVTMIYYETYATRSAASIAECTFKKLSKSQKLDYMLKSVNINFETGSASTRAKK